MDRAAVGYGQDSDPMKATKSGFDDHHVKPIDLVKRERLIAVTAHGQNPLLPAELPATSCEIDRREMMEGGAVVIPNC